MKAATSPPSPISWFRRTIIRLNRIMSQFLFEHDLRASASRLSRGGNRFPPRYPSAGQAFLRIMLPGSGTLTAALVGLGVVVAALLANPVADQVLGTLEFLRPCISGNQTRGLP